MPVTWEQREFRWAEKKPSNLTEWFRKTLAYLDAVAFVADHNEQICKDAMQAALDENTAKGFERAKVYAKRADSFRDQKRAANARKNAIRQRFNERVLSRYFSEEQAKVIGVFLFESGNVGTIGKRLGYHKSQIRFALQAWSSFLRYLQGRALPDPDASEDPSSECFAGHPELGTLEQFTSDENELGVMFSDNGEWPGLGGCEKETR